MEKKSYISSGQIILLLLVTRLLFSTSYQSSLNAGNSIQDILPAILVNFVINFIVAIPILILIKRHPGHDLVECTKKVFGKGFAAVIAVLYYLFFLVNATIVTGNWGNFFSTSLIPNVSIPLTTFFILIVCVYGAIKGIETIARVGCIAAVLYLLVLVAIFASLLPLVNLGYLKPMFYNGPKYFIGALGINYSLSIQIVCIAFLTSFQRQGGSTKKTYFIWNVVSMLTLLVLEFFVVTISGAFGALNYNPLELISSISSFSVFQNLDALDFIPWVLNAIITVTVYLYLAVLCLLKAGLNNHRKLICIISGVAIFFVAPVLSSHFDSLQDFVSGPYASILTTMFAVVIPIIILIVDSVKGRLMQNEKTA